VMSGKTHHSPSMGPAFRQPKGDVVAISVSLRPVEEAIVLGALSQWIPRSGLSAWSLHSLPEMLCFSAALRIEEPWAASYTWAMSNIGPMQAVVTSLRQHLSRYGIEARLEGGEIRDHSNELVWSLSAVIRH
jgi:hypothetical protein